MIDIRIKESFFDRTKVIRSIDRARAKSLSKAGAFVMTRSRRSIRTTKDGNYSKPGQPPKQRGTKSFRGRNFNKSILFGYDKRSGSVVIGPIGDSRSKIPATLEYGGSETTRRDRYIVVKGRTSTGKRKTRRIPKGTKITNRPRPYMGPALREEIAAGSIPKAFRNSVREGG